MRFLFIFLALVAFCYISAETSKVLVPIFNAVLKSRTIQIINE
jgi:hypothetical protein